MLTKFKKINYIMPLLMLVCFIFNIICMFICETKAHLRNVFLSIKYAWNVMMGDLMWRVVSAVLILFAVALITVYVIVKEKESRNILIGPMLLLVFFAIFIYATAYYEVLLKTNIYLVSIYILLGSVFINLIYNIVLLIKKYINEKVSVENNE